MKKIFLLSIALLTLSSCATQEQKSTDINGLDKSIKPGDDFFMFVNKKWVDATPIPSTQAGVGAYMFMNFPQKLRLQGILENVSQRKQTAGSIEQKVGDFYASGIDTITIDKRGYDPIKPTLKRIEGITNISSLMKFVANEIKVGNGSIMSFGVILLSAVRSLLINKPLGVGYSLPR